MHAGAVACAGPCVLALLPAAAAPLPAPDPALPAARRTWWTDPLLAGARAVLRRPTARQLALRILKHFPGVYARVYRLMMAPGAAASAPTRATGVLSPRATAILRTLRTLPASAPAATGRRLRLAFVSPMPPARTGIATYAAELAAELAAHADLTFVVAQPDVALPPALAGIPVHSGAWFAEHGDSFDQVLYQFGNSPLHSHMFALLARYPGVVVLHDFFLGGALAHAQMSGALPGAWSDALLHAHGYGAVLASTADADGAGQAQAHHAWPASLAVLEGATRVIVHSHHARQLAADWYGAAAARHIDVIPLPRAAPVQLDRQAARAALGIPADCFLVCSFGFIAPNKLIHELLHAWQDSALQGNPACALVLVGANHDSPYGMQVEQLLRAAGASNNVRIAGWTDEAVYTAYLQAADVGVQLRTNARGESSAALLDSMNYGLPTIVNANGSMAELPADTVWRLPDTFTVADLAGALETLWRDPVRRQALGQRAAALLAGTYRTAQCVDLYLATLAQARAETQAQHAAWRMALAGIAGDDEAALVRLAATLAQDSSGAPAMRRQLLVDVGTADALASGQVRALLAEDGPALRVEPVWLDTSCPLPCYRQARNATGRLLGLLWPVQAELVVDIRPGDIFYAPDVAAPSVATAAQRGLFAAMRARGVLVNMLARGPLDDASLAVAAGADRILCTSAQAAQQLAGQLTRLQSGRVGL